jgi:glyoxylase-like metal-dependent hydrolase (beta-lactamase superfamily II)
MRIHHLNTGTLCPMGARFVNGTGPWFARARMVCHVLLVETSDGLVLVDGGLGTGDAAHPDRLGRAWVRQVSPRLLPSETAIARVQALGFSPRDVRHVVLTHLDLDHAGAVPDFPWAKIHVSARELGAARARSDARGRRRYVVEQIPTDARWSPFDEGGERWFGFEGVRALEDRDANILLVPLAGHTVGHTGVAVRKGDRWLLHAGDSYFFHGQMLATPTAPPVLRYFQRRADTDRAARIANQERVRRLALDHANEVSVFCAHDPVEYDRLAAASGDVAPVGG